MATDMLNREIRINDYVVSYNNLYVVLNTNKTNAKIKLVNPSPTSRSQMRYGKEMVIVDPDAVVAILGL
jgi:hypothetical protein